MLIAVLSGDGLAKGSVGPARCRRPTASWQDKTRNVWRGRSCGSTETYCNLSGMAAPCGNPTYSLSSTRQRNVDGVLLALPLPRDRRLEGAAGPADARQGSRGARPAPPADGLDLRRLARRMFGHAPMARRERSNALVATNKLAPFSGLSLCGARRHGSSKFSTGTNAAARTIARRSLRLSRAASSTKRAAGKEGAGRVDRHRRLAGGRPDHLGRDRGVRSLVR